MHEIAQRTAPTSTVVYVDNDPVAVAHIRKILDANPAATAIHADLRSPETILAAPEVTALLDFSEPIVVLMLAALHFIPDTDDPAGIVARYMDAVVPGSYLVISHGTPAPGPAARYVDQATEVYSRSVNGFHLRDRDQVTSLFGSLDLLAPGVVHVTDWRPDSLAASAARAARLPQLGAVARKCAYEDLGGKSSHVSGS